MYPEPRLDSFNDSNDRRENRRLEQLSADLRAARRSVSSERAASRHVTEFSVAQETLLAALEAYVGELASAGHPVPYRLRDELFIHRRLAQFSRVGPR